MLPRPTCWNPSFARYSMRSPALKGTDFITAAGVADVMESVCAVASGDCTTPISSARTNIIIFTTVPSDEVVDAALSPHARTDTGEARRARAERAWGADEGHNEAAAERIQCGARAGPSPAGDRCSLPSRRLRRSACRRPRARHREPRLRGTGGSCRADC